MPGAPLTWHVSYASIVPRVYRPCLGPALLGPHLSWAGLLSCRGPQTLPIRSSARRSKSSPGGAKPQAKLGWHKGPGAGPRQAGPCVGWLESPPNLPEQLGLLQDPSHWF